MRVCLGTREYLYVARATSRYTFKRPADGHAHRQDRELIRRFFREVRFEVPLSVSETGHAPTRLTSCLVGP